MTAAYYQHVNAGNDVNGNPRRAFLIVSDAGELLETVDEGYAGRGAIEKAGHDRAELRELPGLDITPAQYRDLVRKAKGS